MWSSNIGWNADRPIGSSGVGTDRKESHLAAQHHFWAMQRSSDNVRALSRLVERLATWSFAVPPSACDGIPAGPWLDVQQVCPAGSRPCRRVERAHGENAPARSSMRPKSRWLSTMPNVHAHRHHLARFM